MCQNAGSDYQAHSAPLVTKLGILDIFQVNAFQVAKFTFYYHNQLLPPMFLNLFVTSGQVHNYGTRTANSYRSHPCRTNLKQFTILYQGPKICNSLPASITCSSSLPSFKKQILELLFVSVWTTLPTTHVIAQVLVCALMPDRVFPGVCQWWGGVGGGGGAPGVGTQEKRGQGISGGRSRKDERRETGRNWKTIEKTQRDSKEYGEVGNRSTWNGKQELQNSGYLYTGLDRNRSKPNQTGPDWLQFTRDHSGNGPERIQNWSYRKGGLVLDPFRAGS